MRKLNPGTTRKTKRKRGVGYRRSFWWENGTLQTAILQEFWNATEENQLATASDWISITNKQGGDYVLKKMDWQTPDELYLLSYQLNGILNNLKNEEVDPSTSGYVAACFAMQNLGWLTNAEQYIQSL